MEELCSEVNGPESLHPTSLKTPETSGPEMAVRVQKDDTPSPWFCGRWLGCVCKSHSHTVCVHSRAMYVNSHTERSGLSASVLSKLSQALACPPDTFTRLLYS